MEAQHREHLIQLAREGQIKTDPSHDFDGHVMRVTLMAEKIGSEEGADLDIVTPAALFHDTVLYPKDSPRNAQAPDDSALVAYDLLTKQFWFPPNKVRPVMVCISECSFRKGIVPETIESKVLQDADLLESTGVIAIMRTFSSCGQMNRPFYDLEDPFRENTLPEKVLTGVDLFFHRLLIAEDRMHTATAKNIAARRTGFLRKFLGELRLELVETGHELNMLRAF